MWVFSQALCPARNPQTRKRAGGKPGLRSDEGSGREARGSFWWLSGQLLGSACLPLYVWEVEDQLENIPEASPAGIRITIEGQVQYSQSL